MLERQYFYLVAGLPDIILDQKKLSVNIDTFKEELQYHLHPEDFKLVEILFLPYDNTNLLNMLSKSERPFNYRGNYSKAVLEENIKEPNILPYYMQKFIYAYKSETPIYPGYSWENQLTWLYYDYALKVENNFLNEWLSFDLHVKNVLTAFGIRRHKLSKEYAFIGDNELTEALKRSTLNDYGLSNDYPFIENLLAIDDNTSLREREYSVDMLRWSQTDELLTFRYFTIEVLLAYLVRMFMVERWLKLDPEKGREIFRKIISDMEKSYEFPKEFNI